MREAVRAEVGDYQMYEARRAEYATADTVPFHVADTPLELSSSQYDELQRICREVANFVGVVDTLYRADETAAELLNRGKSEIFLKERPSEHLFIRPDLIITDDGFAVCEVETSPFGLGVAQALNSAYQSEGHETVTNGELSHHLDTRLPLNGTIVYSQKTQAYRGQLAYINERLFSASGRDWQVRPAEEAPEGGLDNVYRAFYLHEYDTDPAVREVVETGEDQGSTWLPSLTPHLEEKALMAFLWDDRWEGHLRSELGDTSYDYLRTVIPPTLIVGEEAHFMPGLPGGVGDVAGLAALPRSKRELVLKASGYNAQGSWGESVKFLHQKSQDRAAKLLIEALMRDDGLHILQEFRRGRKIPMSFTEDGRTETVAVRVRLTPYVDPTTGDIIDIKATGRAGTDFIHGASDSINTAVRLV